TEHVSSGDLHRPLRLDDLAPRIRLGEGPVILESGPVDGSETTLRDLVVGGPGLEPDLERVLEASGGALRQNPDHGRRRFPFCADDDATLVGPGIVDLDLHPPLDWSRDAVQEHEAVQIAVIDPSRLAALRVFLPGGRW